MSEVEYSILGPLVVRLAPGAAPIALGDKMQMLLGRMLLEPGRTLTAGLLANDVWGDEADLADPRNTVQATMRQVRRRLGDTGATFTVIVSDDSGYRLVVSDPFQIDAERFRRLARRGRALLGEHPRAARAMLEEALACWRGRPLGEHADRHWAIGHAVELETQRAGAEADLNDVRLALGEHRELEPLLRHQLRSHPADERRWIQLVRALDGDGRAAEASLAYREAARELGGAGPELRRLGDRIGRGMRAEAPRAPRAAASPRPDGALLCAVVADQPLGTLALLIDGHGGVPYPLSGSRIVATFADAEAALAAAEALAAHPRLRPAVAVHAGPIVQVGDLLAGPGPARVRRLADAAHAGQVLVSAEVRGRVRTPLAELGEQRLEDLLPGEPLYALADTRAPDTLSARPHNLPVQPTRFVGREHELTELSRALGPGQLVTLLGVGGCGKTRLALQVAAERLGSFDDGAWFVELAELAPGVEADALAVAAGNQLSLRPLADEAASAALARHFSDRAALLILDNAEHVLEAVVALVACLRERCPRLCVLATSRQPLRVDGERVIEVPAMGTGEPAEADVLPDAVELLLERAGGAAVASLHDALRICRALEGSPLAIELAAAHVATRGMEGVAVEVESMVAGRLPLDRLRSKDPKRPPRQRTIDETIRWSHRLLSEDERTVLHRLAVFRGSFGLDEARVVAADDVLGPESVAELVNQLVERSLVAPEPPLFGEARLRLSQPIRAFARGELPDAEFERVQARHVSVFVALAVSLAPRLFGADEHFALERLEADHDNLRAALDRLVARGDAEGAMTLVGALWWLWFSRGHFEEGAKRVAEVLALDPQPSRRRVRALRAGSHLSWWRGDYEQTGHYNHALEACARDIDDAWGLAWAPMGYGAVAMFTEPERALALFEDSRARFMALGREWEAAYALQLVAAARWYGDAENLAGEAYEAASEIFEGIGHGSVLASVRRGAGLMAARCGESDRGEVLCRDALRFTDRIGDRAGSAQALNFLAAIARDAGELVTAVERYAAGLTHAREIGELWAICSALDGIAGVACAFEEPELATHLLSRSKRLADRAGYVWSPHELRLRMADTSRLRARLGDRDYERLVAEGQLMSEGDAVGSALAFAGRVS